MVYIHLTQACKVCCDFQLGHRYMDTYTWTLFRRCWSSFVALASFQEILLVLSFLSEKCWEISRPVLVRQPDPSTRERRDEEGGRAQDSSRTTAVVGMDPRRLLEQEEEEEKLSRGEGRYFGFDGEDYTLSFDEVKM